LQENAGSQVSLKSSCEALATETQSSGGGFSETRRQVPQEVNRGAPQTAEKRKPITLTVVGAKCGQHRLSHL
jgi:hypothetical protein